MRFKNITSIYLLIFLWVFSSTSFAESSVWKISKGSNYFYLGGTVHLLDSSDHPLPEEFSTAYNDSDKLIFETDISGSKTQESQQKFLYAMLYKSQKTLKDDLSVETYQNLSKFLTSRNIPIENLMQFKPWAVAVTIAVLEYQRLGMMPEHGVEEHFNRLASSDNKQLGSLESLDEQISFISSMGNIEPNLMVNYTLRDLKTLPEFIQFLKKSWRTGDIEAFTSNSVIAQMKSEFPDLYHTLLTKRNNNWMSDLITLNDNNITEFVLVGALHLSGKEGLLNQLKAAGYKAEQVSQKSVPENNIL